MTNRRDLNAESTGNPIRRPRVYIATAIPDDVRGQIEVSCDVERYTGPGRATRDDLERVLPGVTGILTSNQLKIDNDLIVANPQLRVVSNNGVGYDNVDIPFATEHGLLVCHTREVLNAAVADLTYTFILALAKRLVEANEWLKGGSWRPGGTPFPLGVDLRDKTLGILGFGRIGHAVARRAGAFGLNALYYDPVRDPEAEDSGLATYAERDEVVSSADFISLHVFLDETTRGHFGEREFQAMKPGAYFINTSRGPVVDQRALAMALSEGWIAGAALDVFQIEPIPADDPLLSSPNLLVAPHIASGTVETRRAMVELAARNLIAAVTGGTPETMVNPEALQVRA
ncbi:MAG TPA: D-glycerate dehydrogenase [Dehalococcoidia bacterium]